MTLEVFSLDLKRHCIIRTRHPGNSESEEPRNHKPLIPVDCRYPRNDDELALANPVPVELFTLSC